MKEGGSGGGSRGGKKGVAKGKSEGVEQERVKMRKSGRTGEKRVRGC